MLNVFGHFMEYRLGKHQFEVSLTVLCFKPAIRPMGLAAHGHPTQMGRVWVVLFAHGSPIGCTHG